MTRGASQHTVMAGILRSPCPIKWPRILGTRVLGLRRQHPGWGSLRLQHQLSRVGMETPSHMFPSICLDVAARIHGLAAVAFLHH